MKKIIITKTVYPLEAGKRTYTVSGVTRTKQEHELFMQGVIYTTPNIQVLETTEIHSPHNNF